MQCKRFIYVCVCARIRRSVCVISTSGSSVIFCLLYFFIVFQFFYILFVINKKKRKKRLSKMCELTIIMTVRIIYVSEKKLYVRSIIVLFFSTVFNFFRLKCSISQVYWILFFILKTSRNIHIEHFYIYIHKIFFTLWFVHAT